MEQEPQRNGGGEQQGVPAGEWPLARLLEEVPPYDFLRRGAVLEGIETAEFEERGIDDRTARHIAVLLGGRDGPLSAFATTGEVGEEIGGELAAVVRDDPSPEARNWADCLQGYCLNRIDRGSVDGWTQRLDAIDRAHHAYQRLRQDYRWAEVRQLEASLTEEIVMVQERGLVLEEDAIVSAGLALARRRHLWREHFFVWIATGEASGRLREELTYLHQRGTAEIRLWAETLDAWASDQSGQHLLPKAGPGEPS